MLSFLCWLAKNFLNGPSSDAILIYTNFNIDIILELEEGIFINSLANEFSQAFINILNNAKDAIVLNLKDDENGLSEINRRVEFKIIGE